MKTIHDIMTKTAGAGARRGRKSAGTSAEAGGGTAVAERAAHETTETKRAAGRPKAADVLMESIEAFAAGDTSSPLPFRLRNAVERVRSHICGLFGVKAATVSDAHVAKFLGRVSPEYLFRHLPGIGYQTEEELLKWAAVEAGMGQGSGGRGQGSAF